MQPKTKGTISTKDGDFIFEYCLDYHPHLKSDVYFFDIWRDGDDLENLHKFSLLLRVMENGSDLKVVDLFAGDYKGKGISIPIILKSKQLFNKRIISSSNKLKSYSGEANWDEAVEKVWKPLVSQELAKYDIENDYYFVL